MTTRAATLVARTASAIETQQLAAALAALAQPGDLVVLAGDLGAGKTTFTQGFGRALGVTEPITSPTFTLAQQYEGRLRVHHLDVYRLDQLAEVAELGLSELLDDGGVVLIEWGDAILGVLPSDYLEVRLTYGDRGQPGEGGDDDRQIVVRGVGGRWAGRQVSLLHAVAPWAEAPNGAPGDRPC
ncbi:MAG: tRNA (adenosine(37)-N6)-threonylcarbamoyltransferase complex ATPase subunit type 1 TsaE [Acidimicrobiales bacterium]